MQLPAQRWTESEAGWGQRPDGFTVHRDLAEAKHYANDFWKKEHERNPSGRVPDIYTFPDGDPVMIEVSDDLHDAVTQQGTVWGHYSSGNLALAADWKPSNA